MGDKAVLSESGLGRRGFLKKGAIGAAVVAGAVASPAMTGVASASDDAQTLKLDVLADVTALDIAAGGFAGQGSFYIPGTIFRHGGDTPIGDFHCWGWFIQGGAVGVVCQEFDLLHKGKIQVQGIEDEGQRAVVGGTKRYRRVRGQMRGSDLSAFPAFTVTFRLENVIGNA